MEHTRDSRWWDSHRHLFSTAVPGVDHGIPESTSDANLVQIGDA